MKKFTMDLAAPESRMAPGDDGTEDDGHADAAQRAAEAIGDGRNGGNRVIAQNGAGNHTADKQGNDGMDVQLNDHENQDCNRNQDCKNKLRHKHTS